MTKKIIEILTIMMLSCSIFSVSVIGANNFNKSEDQTIQLLKSNQNMVFLDLPSSFDLRNVDGENFVSGVRRQKGGTCWCHAVYASMESNLLITDNWATAGEDGEPNLAEYHMDWWNGFNTFHNDDYPDNPGGVIVHEGGDYLMASAYLIRGEGAVRQCDGQSYSTPPERYNSSYHYYYPRDIEWYGNGSGSDLGNIDIIKSKLMANGAIATCMVYYPPLYYNRTLNSHYFPPWKPGIPNHAIAIIGWDDDKITQAPEGPGAWLVKDSQGELVGEDGFYWISYYDKHCAKHKLLGAASFQNIELLSYDNIYYHDYHGWRDTLEGCSEAFNAFVASDWELLTSVSFFTSVHNVSYAVKIYDQFEDGELQDELSSQMGIIEFRGFHTVDLETPVRLVPNQDFYVYVSISNGGQAFDRTSHTTELGETADTRYPYDYIESIANPNESFYRNDSTWYDLYDYGFLEDEEWNHSANFCIKALTIKRTSPELSIESISGGLGVNAIIKNCGDVDVENIEWTMTASGGLLGFVYEEINGTISEFEINQKVEVNLKPFFGLGPITIEVEASIAGAITFTEKVEGKLIFCFVAVS